ncbi:cystatin-like protein [Neoarius graeffei]|uniref:cystatin-like protein n=1 Tax=Neoarius graeffei TaxID=443677 RepID=UPI00298D1A8E|nr:cystatin-like protein [Neoarius graeffei]
MDRALKVLLLATLILLVSAQTWSNYRSLSDVVRKYIDKILENANQKFGGNYHVAFHSLKGNPNTMESNFYVNVHLIVTTCKKTSPKAYEHRDDCIKQKQKTPIIDCLVCKKKDGKELVDCARLMDVKNGKCKEIRDKCNEYHTGGGSLMQTLPSGYEEKQIGCLGCV